MLVSPFQATLAASLSSSAYGESRSCEGMRYFWYTVHLWYTWTATALAAAAAKELISTVASPRLDGIFRQWTVR